MMLASVLPLFACGSRHAGPEVDSVEPTSAGVVQLPVPVTIRGAHFLGARVSLDDSAPARVLLPEASIGGEPLTSVTVIAPDTLTGFVPATLAVGTHDVEVRLANGQFGVLEGGFEVTPAAVAPIGSEDTPTVPVATGCNAGELGTPERVWPASSSDERGPALSADRLTLVFSRVSLEGEELYYATRPNVDATFGAPRQFEEFTGGLNTTPVLSTDQLEIYFASHRTGDWDIWTADRSAVGLTFGNLRQLMTLSSLSDEMRPWISADQLTIYFESNRMGMGADVWKATRATAADDFAAPQLVTWLNTPNNESSASTTPNQLTCFYVSDSLQNVGWKTLLRTQRSTIGESFNWGTSVAALSAFNVNGYASLAPDGRELVFSAAGTTQQIWRVPVSCSE